MTGSDPFIRSCRNAVLVASLLLIPVSCIFNSSPSEPGFPSVVDSEISFTSIGEPSLCKCMIDYDLALVAASNSLVILDIVGGTSESVIDIGLEIDDIADSDANGYGYIVADSLFYPVNLSIADIEDAVNIGVSCSFISVTPEGDAAWLAMDNDSLGLIDLQTYEVTVEQDIILGNCQGIATAGDGVLYISDGNSSFIAGYDTDTWTEIGRVSVPGEVYDLFPGPSGYICAIVNGSNELWFIKSDTASLYKMITFPVVPTAATSMPDGSFAYAACPETGMIVVAESGQMELRSMDFGVPSSIDISQNGDRAVICSPENQAVYILVK